MFVLLYVLCVLLCRCSFVCVRHSIFYVCVACCDLYVTISLSEKAREKARWNNNDLSYVPSKRKEEIKSGTSGCGSFVVPYFQPATSTDRLHSYSYTLQQYNTTQYNVIAKCQYSCTRNVLWCKVHSSYIHSNHKTLNYNNSK